MPSSVITSASRFRTEVFPRHGDLYRHLAQNGQRPKALVISCADSRVIPEEIMQSGPGEIFVCRNAGNIVPPTAQFTGGVSASIEYAVVVLGVRDIVICGHSDCGAMKALLQPDSLKSMPNVQAWLRHADAARCVVCESYPDLESKAAARALAMENVALQLNHLRTHASVAARLARGEMTLHGWFFDLETGGLLALDGEKERFVEVAEGAEMPVAVTAAERRVA
ncbi:carbonic anhydrase [Roseomonas gilardii]|uniref:carbonic anhydrase n=1 Tax=Roseomonas gilardii TaxID=257708 RepID=UPI0011A199CB|nr:carbonic anhydrase [Roseomonas gilardii]